MFAKLWGRQRPVRAGHGERTQELPVRAGHAEINDKPAEKPAPAEPKVSPEERSRLIQARAYSLWEQAGKPEGDAARERFWCEAEKQIMASSAGECGG